MPRLEFLQIRQNIFFRAQNNHSPKTPKFERCKDGKLKARCSKITKRSNIVNIPTLSDPSKVRNARYF